jgi:Glycosyltransferase family 87
VSGTRVTASSALPSPEAGAPSQPGDSRRRWAVSAVIIVATLLAAGLRLYNLSRPGYLFGISEYDDGTDLGSAVRLVHGALPYRDFIMVQPPGITLIMYPVALATKSFGTDSAMAVARVITALASAAAVPLAGLLTRHRGLFAVLVSCGVLAIYPDSILAARTVLLEPWLVLFCLLGALAVFDGDRIADSRRRIFLGGLLFGFAGAVKVWAILPVAVILVLTARRRRQATAYAAGVVLGFCVPVLPFALTAPVTFYRSVIIAQLVRHDIVRIPEGYRLQQMLGLVHSAQLATPALVIIGIVVVLVVAAVTVLGSRLAHNPPPGLDWFAAGTCALVVAAFLWPADFYYHYAGFLAPFLALALALPLSRLLVAAERGRALSGGGREARGREEQSGGGRGARGREEQSGGEARDRDKQSAGAGQAEPAGESRRWLALLRPTATVVAGVALIALTLLQIGAESNEYSGIPGSEIAAAKRLIPPGACVATDQVSYTIAINRFVSTVPGCSLMIDGVGTDYALSNGRNGQTGASSSPAVEAAWMSAFRAAKYAWLTSEAYRRISWTPQLTAYFDSHFVRLMTTGLDRLYIRAAHPVPGRLKGIPAAPPSTNIP